MAHARALEISFSADDNAGKSAASEVVELIVVANLHAADYAAANVVGDAAVCSAEIESIGIAVASSPAAAQVKAGVEACPKRRWWRRSNRSLA